MACREETSRRDANFKNARPQRGQPQVATAHGVVALLFQVVEEREYQIRLDIDQT